MLSGALCVLSEPFASACYLSRRYQMAFIGSLRDMPRSAANPTAATAAPPVSKDPSAPSTANDTAHSAAQREIAAAKSAARIAHEQAAAAKEAAAAEMSLMRRQLASAQAAASEADKVCAHDSACRVWHAAFANCRAANRHPPLSGQAHCHAMSARLELFHRWDPDRQVTYASVLAAGTRSCC